MKRHTGMTFVVAALLTLSSAASAASPSPTIIPSSPTTDGFGIGFILGDPSGISASLPVGANNAFNVLAGYQTSYGGANLALLGDYVWHVRDLIPVEVGKISFYYGPGVRTLFAREFEAGIRVVLGVDYLFEGTPLQALFEISPGINIVPDTEPTVTGGLGLRYFF